MKGSLLAAWVVLSLVPGCAAVGALHPIFGGPDRERGQIPVYLKPVLAGGVTVSARSPTDLGFLPVDPERPSKVLLVAERSGGLRWFDLRTGEGGYLLQVEALSLESEQGLLGFALHPDFPRVPEIYTHHVAPGGFAGVSTVTRWRVWGDDVRSMTASPEVLLSFRQPQAAHNGGQVRFGPDGMLYVGFGDGGWQGDPANRGQSRQDLHGTLVRLDVSVSEGYAVPLDNPFVDGGHRAEVWAFGFRNPWRFDWGPGGVLLLADVGQERIEEIDRVVPGGNYGWSLKEGSLCYGLGRIRPGECSDPTLIDPIFEYRHSEGRAVVGGRFYRGRRIPALAGRFVFGDYTNGRLWALDPGDSDGSGGEVAALGGFGIAPVAFGEDAQGELYVAAQAGRIYRLVPGSGPPPEEARASLQ